MPVEQRDPRREAIVAARPALHRYCARLTGSIFDGEDVVQDTIERALMSLDTLPIDRAVQPWLFRIAHNRAIDFLRRRRPEAALDVDPPVDVPDPDADDPESAALRRQTVGLAIVRFVALPVTQRAVVVLKDVLDHSLDDIGELLEMRIAAVKSSLHRARAALARSPAPPRMPARDASADLARFIALFNARDWDRLRSLLADDVRLDQIARSARTGRADVGVFFTHYAALDDWHLRPGFVEGREIAIVARNAQTRDVAYFMRIEWCDGRIAVIHDSRHARYLVRDAAIADG